MADPILLRADEGAVAVLVLNAPASFNALSEAMLAALEAAIADIAADPAIRVVVIRAEGKAFCAGHDLKEMQAHRGDADGGRSYYQALFDRCAAMMQALAALPQPVIAAVQGIATAAGCQLVATCDMAVAATGTRFGVNGINIGLFCSTPMVALTRKVAPALAFEMLSTGAFIDADRAREAGLVNRVVPPEALLSETMALARAVAAKLPAAIRTGKAGFYEQAALPLERAYALAGARMVENMLDPDTDEGICAFLDKRPPGWAPRS
ncbi:enoyl-CoA hydratase [Tabrizicola fusiformis]|uniref:enoyl-CoA hydratase n=1 Tax=Tabrizicola sp. SY72 TaxID=2741673 RepID=UPI00157403D6|nr:enoyl-CoA hydratase [Tabrizicola sp. SY72]NTT88460.1 enoyl-CoA hydratase [Tabrizicola sp. SY72]